MGNSKNLTPKQEKFLQEYIKNGISYKAYLAAYPAAKYWTRNAVDVEANKLLNNPKISLRIQEYNKKIESTLEASTTLNKRRILTEIIELQQKCKSQDSQNTVNLQALKLLSQIAGLLQENKTEINITNNNQTVNEVIGYLDL